MKNVWQDLKEILTNFFHSFGWAWWVEIVTQTPDCTYYFGPFTSAVEADAAKVGYVEDLESESAQGIQVTIKRCKPVQMTIDYEENQDVYSSSKSSMSGQFG